MSDAEDRVDQVFVEAFETNHPAMLDWVTIKFELQELRNKSKSIECQNTDCDYNSEGTCTRSQPRCCDE